MWVGQTEFVKATSSFSNGHRYPVEIISHEPQDSPAHPSRVNPTVPTRVCGSVRHVPTELVSGPVIRACPDAKRAA